MADSALLLLSTCSTHGVASQSRQSREAQANGHFQAQKALGAASFHLKHCPRNKPHHFPGTHPVQPRTLVGLRVVNVPFGAVSVSLHCGWLNIIRHAQLRVGRLAFPCEVFRLQWTPLNLRPSLGKARNTVHQKSKSPLLERQEQGAEQNWGSIKGICVVGGVRGQETGEWWRHEIE